MRGRHNPIPHTRDPRVSTFSPRALEVSVTTSVSIPSVDIRLCIALLGRAGFECAPGHWNVLPRSCSACVGIRNNVGLVCQRWTRLPLHITVWHDVVSGGYYDGLYSILGMRCWVFFNVICTVGLIKFTTMHPVRVPLPSTMTRRILNSSQCSTMMRMRVRRLFL